MAPSYRFFVIAACVSVACAHVRLPAPQPSLRTAHIADGNLSQALRWHPEPRGTSVEASKNFTWPSLSTQHLRGSGGTKATGKREGPKGDKGGCLWLALMLVAMCVCMPKLQAEFGPMVSQQISTFITFFVVFYLIFSGIWSDWYGGGDVGIWCKIVCIWASIVLCCNCFAICLICCCGAIVLGVHHHIKNEAIKKMAQDYDEKIKKISGPRRDYYESDAFKDKCADLFTQADADKSGTLTFTELKEFVKDYLGCADNETASMFTELLQKTFDENGDSVVEPAEFVEMMKYVSVVMLQEGKFSYEQAFEIMQLDPAAADSSSLGKAKRKMAMKYHPDKAVRNGVSKEVAERDQAEINDAAAKCQQYLNMKAEGKAPDLKSI